MRRDADRRRIERRLPRRYRGTGPGFRRLIDDIPLRIVVTGTRGKTRVTLDLERHLDRRGHDTMAKVTGTAPFVMRNGQKHETPRYGLVLLDETVWELKRHGRCEAAIIENQAIGEYGMRIVNDAVRPHFTIITNARRDHQDQQGRDLPRIAKSFGRSVHPETTVLCGETDPAAAELLRQEVEGRGAAFIHIPGRPDDPPSLSNLHLVNKMLELLHSDGIPEDEWAIEEAAVRRRMKFHPGPVPVFDASEANDVDSTDQIVRHLADDMPLTWVLYLRGDRRERSHAFLQFLQDKVDAGEVHDVHVAGRHARLFAKRLDFPAKVQSSRAKHIDRVVDDLTESGLPVIMAGNGADPWPRLLSHRLTGSPV